MLADVQRGGDIGGDDGRRGGRRHPVFGAPGDIRGTQDEQAVVIADRTKTGGWFSERQQTQLVTDEPLGLQHIGYAEADLAEMTNVVDVEGMVDAVIQNVTLDELEYRVIGSGEVDAAGLPMGRAVEFVVPLTVGLQGYPD